MNKFEGGSEWRKWDLHIHTKNTQKNDKFVSRDFNTFCITMFRKALENDIAAIGITDYFNIENYKKVKDFVDDLDSCNCFNEQERAKIKQLFLLPNVELRILPATNRGSLINIHCIFNPDTIFLKSLENDFFGSLEDSGGNKMNRAGFVALGRSSESNLNDDAAYKKGIEKFHLEPSKLIELFKNKPALKENTIIVVSNSNQDGASALQNHYKFFENETGSLDAIRNYIYKLSDAIFSGNPKDREFFLGEKDGCDKNLVIQKCGSLKPCIHGSDAHNENKLFNPDENRFCWIKADLTFEGLKQILCEPKGRVKIQANEPEDKSGYHVIKSINIDDRICKQTIVLNPNLNTIIGGRSTGKSTLLELIAYRINSKVGDIKDFIKNIPKESVKILWLDNEENKARDIEFFPQNYMHQIASNKERKNTLIQDIVTDKDNKKLISNYEKFCAANKTKLQTDIDNLFELQASLIELTDKLKETGDEGGLKKEIEHLEKRIDGTRKGDSFSEVEGREFEKLGKEILRIEQEQKKLENDIEKISALKDEDLFDGSFSYKFNVISGLNSQSLQAIFDDVKEQAMIQWQKKLSEKLQEINNQVKVNKKSIQAKSYSGVFVKGKGHFEKNKQYKELNDRLNIETKKLEKIVSIQTRIDRIKRQKAALQAKIVENHLEYHEQINKLKDDYLLTHDDISIKIEKTYRNEKCEGLLSDFINLQSHERQRFVSEWGDKYISDIKGKIAEFLKDALVNKIELKAYKDVKDLTKGLLTENWFSISYELAYQNDTFEKMSDGKKAFVILKLLLEFSNKECPILIDQPEDSLDNRAIYNELVTYLKQKKQDRQIILVTHNANIVVNADAEEVIVANQHGEDSKNKNGIKFQYISGSLENKMLKNPNTDIVLESQGIREHVCEILEGGAEAFKKRENRYAIGNQIKIKPKFV